MCNTLTTLQYNSVTFGYSRELRAWQFAIVTLPDFSYLGHCKGKAVAEKVARIIDGANKRTKGNGLDGMARAMIAKLG